MMIVSAGIRFDFEGGEGFPLPNPFFCNGIALLLHKKAFRGIVLWRKGRCRLRGLPQAESFASDTLFTYRK